MNAAQWRCAMLLGTVAGLGCVPTSGGAGSADGGELAPTTGTATPTTTEAPADTTQGPSATTMVAGSADTTSAPPSSSSGGMATTTGGATLSCAEAVDQRQCMIAGDEMVACGWIDTNHVVMMDMMCVEEQKDGVCLPISQGDDTCGLMRDPSCGNGSIVFVRPSDLVDGANETMVLQPFDVCSGPDPGEGWILCVPGSMVPGCRCGCVG